MNRVDGLKRVHVEPRALSRHLNLGLETVRPQDNESGEGDVISIRNTT